jgi:hypothetical protein
MKKFTAAAQKPLRVRLVWFLALPPVKSLLIALTLALGFAFPAHALNQTQGQKELHQADIPQPQPEVLVAGSRWT